MTNTGSPGISPPGLAPLPVEAFSSYVVGSPVHVAITLRADRPTATLKRLPLPTHDSYEGAIGLVCKDASGDVIGVLSPAPLVDPDLGAFGFTLPAGAERRLLVDLFDALPWSSITPAEYTLTLTYAAPSTRTTSPPFTVRFERPTPEERRVLDELAPERARAGSWGAWSRTPPADPLSRDPGAVAAFAALRGPFSANDPLRHLRIWRYLLWGPDDLAVIDPAIFGVLDGPYAPEADLLAAELAWARGDQAAFNLLAQKIRAGSPGLAHWLDAIPSGQTELARADAARKQRKATP